MGFSSDVKNELSSLDLDSVASMKSELMGLIRTNATLSMNFQADISIRFETMAAYIARRIFKIIKKLYNYDCEINVINDDQLKKKNLYQVRISDEIGRYVLEDAGFTIGDMAYLQVNDNFNLVEEVQAGDFLRGAFLGAGSVTEPKKSYHLEIICDTEDSRHAIGQVGKSIGIDFKYSDRKESFVLYLKEGDSISDFLSIIGANNAMLAFENTRVYKEIRNSVNRMVNAETANINKTIEASVRQIQAIEKIEESIGLSALPDNLREIAIARLANPDDSLKDLGDRLARPLGKSGVNHRLKKIEEIADSL